MGLIFTQPCIFGRFLADISETVPLRQKLKKVIFKTIIPSNFPVEHWPYFLLWVPEEELKSEFNREVARTIIPSFPVELQLKFVLWDPLGPPRGVHRGVPEGPKGFQRDPGEELRSVFKGKVARNNYLKNDFFQFLP